LKMSARYWISQIVNEPDLNERNGQEYLAPQRCTQPIAYSATLFPLSSQLHVGKSNDLLAKPSPVSTTKEGTPANGYAETWIFGAYGGSGFLSRRHRRSKA
jgi:hypothetical protein